MRRFASGADSSQPSAARPGGLAAATIRTPGGSTRSPTVRSSTTRSMAACTAGGAVVSSSRNSSPDPAEASRSAQRGGANQVPWSRTTGSPAKSLGSRTEPTTTSTGSPSCRPSATTADVLPVPGAPHSRTAEVRLDGQREGGTHGVVLHNASTVVDGQRRSQRRLTGVTVYDWTMNARYDGLAEWYDEFNAQGAAGNAPELADLLGPGDGLCLDLGCGTGQYLDVIRSTGRTVVGLD